MSNHASLEPDVLHQVKNHLGVILGFCEFLVQDLTEDDPRHADVLEIQTAARAAHALMPELSKLVR